ncbi:MAG: RsmE family RNA methyltransferase [Flavobacteriales bacterium]
MHSFFCPSIDGVSITLQDDEARHAFGVLRLRVGEHICLLDGRGNTAEAEIGTADKHGCTARVVSRTHIASERSARIHIACALTKQVDRFEWMLEKCTEIGVDRITPLLTKRTERAHLRMDRLQKIAISAMKQSKRAWLPQVDGPLAIADLLKSELPAQRYFGWCEGTHAPLMKAYGGAADVILLIGPEGDFTTEEAQLLSSSGFLPTSLGKARLRTETAAIMACVALNLAQVG